jgi:hypothetical protein
MLISLHNGFRMTGRGIFITNALFLVHSPEGNDWVIWEEEWLKKTTKPRIMLQGTDGPQLILWNYFTSRVFEWGLSVGFLQIQPAHLCNKLFNSIKIMLEEKHNHIWSE